MIHEKKRAFMWAISLIVFLACKLPVAFSAEASWLIDARQFHVSVHGKLSCLECHNYIVEEGIHPNPNEVNKELKDFFHVDQCAKCHREVIERINTGFHKRVIASREEYIYCIGCHDPHYQLPLGNSAIRFSPSTSPSSQCSLCHEHRESLPPVPAEVELCMSCHTYVEPGDPQETAKVSRFCFHCHGQKAENLSQEVSTSVPLIDAREYEKTRHAQVSCLICHPNAAQFDHANQASGDCRQCHLPHDEKVAHDAHLIVSCEACHLAGITPIRNPESKQIRWEIDRKAGVPITVHAMTSSSEDAFCRRCHFPKNQVGAAAHVLPAKSIICMPCHTATVSWSDSVTLLSLLVFLLGFLTVASVWISGTFSIGQSRDAKRSIGHLVRTTLKNAVSFPLLSFLRGLILDVFLQRRLLRQSRTRWVIHALIVFPLVFRFFWGLFALVGSLWYPDSAMIGEMLNKNDAATAFLFDLSGALVLLGVTLAFFRRIRDRCEQLSGLRKTDHFALILIAAILVVGFILEGIRMAMTGWPGDAPYAFIGYWISMLFADSGGLTEIYGYIWYLHALLTGAFIVYLPFSRLLHIILSPVILLVNAVTEGSKGRGLSS